MGLIDRIYLYIMIQSENNPIEAGLSEITLELTHVWEEVQSFIAKSGLNLLTAIAILVIGRWLVKGVVRKVTGLLHARKVDPTIIPTIRGIVNVGLMIALALAVINRIGIDTTGLIAAFGAAGLAVGLALQGSLSNFAGGILILTLKPFKAGDFVEVNGQLGSVHAVTIINTILKTVDNKTIYLPNGAVAGANITNYTQEQTRRLEKVFGIGYGDDFEKAKQIILDIIQADARILSDPEPFARVGNLGDSSVDITVRVWAKTEDFWDVNFDLIENVKKEFDKQGISIPFPQRDIHIVKEA